jgi:hypothetical protein
VKGREGREEGEKDGGKERKERKKEGKAEGRTKRRKKRRNAKKVRVSVGARYACSTPSWALLPALLPLQHLASLSLSLYTSKTPRPSSPVPPFL